jgi:hypothetical protein
MSRMFDRLAARDQRRLLKMIERGLEVERRPERVAALLAYDQEHRPESWFREVAALVYPVLNSDTILAWEEIARLAREHGTTPLDVTRMILGHVVEWTSLDAAGRAAAIEKEFEDRQLEEVRARLATLSAQTGPFSAFDFPWGLADGMAFLERAAQEEFIRDTGERAHGRWPIYELVTSKDSDETEGP